MRAKLLALILFLCLGRLAYAQGGMEVAAPDSQAPNGSAFAPAFVGEPGVVEPNLNPSPEQDYLEQTNLQTYSQNPQGDMQLPPTMVGSVSKGTGQDFSATQMAQQKELSLPSSNTTARSDLGVLPGSQRSMMAAKILKDFSLWNEKKSAIQVLPPDKVAILNEEIGKIIDHSVSGQAFSHSAGRPYFSGTTATKTSQATVFTNNTAPLGTGGLLPLTIEGSFNNTLRDALNAGGFVFAPGSRFPPPGVLGRSKVLGFFPAEPSSHLRFLFNQPGVRVEITTHELPSRPVSDQLGSMEPVMLGIEIPAGQPLEVAFNELGKLSANGDFRFEGVKGIQHVPNSPRQALVVVGEAPTWRMSALLADPEILKMVPFPNSTATTKRSMPEQTDHTLAGFFKFVGYKSPILILVTLFGLFVMPESLVEVADVFVPYDRRRVN